MLKKCLYMTFLFSLRLTVIKVVLQPKKISFKCTLIKHNIMTIRGEVNTTDLLFIRGLVSVQNRLRLMARSEILQDCFPCLQWSESISSGGSNGGEGSLMLRGSERWPVLPKEVYAGSNKVPENVFSKTSLSRVMHTVRKHKHFRNAIRSTTMGFGSWLQVPHNEANFSRRHLKTSGVEGSTVDKTLRCPRGLGVQICEISVSKYVRGGTKFITWYSHDGAQLTFRCLLFPVIQSFHTYT